jgi:uncharacterized membrane protein
MSRIKMMAVSGAVIAMYVSIMYLTASFSFMQVQVRIATGLYALSYLFPFLVIPLGLSNALSNMLFGGLGLPDILGGAVAGLVTGGLIYLIRRYRLPAFLVIPVIIFGPGLLAPIWLSALIGVPYSALALSVCAGQVIPGIVGYALIKALPKIGFTEVNK